MKEQVFISGTISRTDKEKTREKFEKAEQMIKSKGYSTVTPLNNGLPESAPWESQMAMNIVILIGCSTLYLLPCWENSPGATLEKSIAEVTGKKIIYEQEPHNRHIKEAISRVLGTSFWEVSSKDQTEKTVFARVIYAKYCRENIENIKIKDIAKDLNRTPGSVQYYLKKYDEFYQFYPDFKNKVGQVKAILLKQDIG